MAIQVDFDAEARVILVECDGVLGDADLVQALEAMRAHPERESAVGGLFDMRNAERIETTTEGVARLVEVARMYDSEMGDFRLATVAREDVDYGMARMYELRRNAGETNRVFRGRAEALAWLTGGDE